MEWFRRKDKNYSNLKNDSEIEMTRHDAEATQRSCSQETSEMCSENIMQYGSFSEEMKAQVMETKITTWQASWNIINMIQVTRIFFLGFITRSILCLDNWFSLTTMVFLSEQGIHFLKV